MALPVRTIGIFTSGGDCAGLNAVIRAMTLCATSHGLDVYGIAHGLWGLFQNPAQITPLAPAQMSLDLMRQGGTMLGSTPRDDLLACIAHAHAHHEPLQNIHTRMKETGLDALIGIGGDGSLRTVERMYREQNIPVIFVPKTIDNDLSLTDNAIGFSTAVDIATEALDRLQPTAASHHRIMILQVMGRDAGHIALHAGIAGGADIVLIPEIPYRLESIHKKIQQVQNLGRSYALCIVAESVCTPQGLPAIRVDAKGRERYEGIGDALGKALETMTGLETRTTVLGHQQRGGQPNATDRLLAAALGTHAIDLVMQNQWGHMVSWRNQNVTSIPLKQVAGQTRKVDVHGTMITAARNLGICFGDQDTF